MKSNDILRGLETIRDPGIAICKSFLAKRNLKLSDDSDTIFTRCLSEAEGNDPEAQYVVATLMLTRVLGKLDEESATRWCARAAEAGYMPAVTMLANLHISGARGIPKDPRRGLELLSKAAEASYPPAVIYLAQAYLHGFQVTQDRDKGLSLIRQAAELGDVMAQLNLGAELVESCEAAARAEGVAWLRAAADKGLHSAHYALALLYRDGKGGVPQNPEIAEHHLGMGKKLEEEWHRRAGLT